MIINKQQILKKVKVILGKKYVRHIRFTETTKAYHITIFYSAVIFTSELQSLDDYFNTGWSSISHRYDYNIILYIIWKNKKLRKV